MPIKTRKRSDVLSSEITSETVYQQRRHFLKKSGQYAFAGLGLVMAGGARSAPAKSRLVSYYKDIPQLAAPEWVTAHILLARFISPLLQLSKTVAKNSEDGVLPIKYEQLPEWLVRKAGSFARSQYTTEEKLTPYANVTNFNNFYEFGYEKTDPAEYAKKFVTDPWAVVVEGEVAKSGKYHLEDFVKPHHIEERIYRLRCVEAWSMVIPWLGFSLADMIKRFEPTSKAKFVEFTTLYDPEQMPGQRSRFSTIEYPYVEGLRIDEALHPLSFVAIGVYGKTLPPQNGAPLRLVVPWKYGFKSIKSIVKVRFTETMPKTTWVKSAHGEYGFYANVNPNVSHPRWSQAVERRLPNSLWNPNRIDTRMFKYFGH